MVVSKSLDRRPALRYRAGFWLDRPSLRRLGDYHRKQTPSALLQTLEGLEVFIKHGSPENWDLTPEEAKQAAQADLVWCCHPAFCRNPTVKEKHPAPEEQGEVKHYLFREGKLVLWC